MTEARIPNDYVIGEVGNGWGVALTTLAFERGFGSLKKPRYTEAKSRVIDEAKAESQEHFKVYSWYPQRAGRADLIEEHARKSNVKLTQSSAKKSPNFFQCIELGNGQQPEREQHES